MHLKLRQLEVFKAVMETGSVSSAAARLNCTQSAVSIALSKFEAEAGLALFDRSRGRFVPTPEAERLHEEVDRGLLGLDRITSKARELREGGVGHLRIAADGAASINFLPKVIAGFIEAHGEVQVDLHTRSSKQIVAWAGGRQIDVGIVEMPVHWPGVAYEPFAQACVCIMPSGHPLARRSVVTPADLDGEAVVSVLENHPINTQLKQAFTAANCRLSSRIGGYYYATCRNLVGHGAGVAIVDAMNGDEALGGGIVARPFQPTIRYDMAIVYPSAPPPSPLVRSFIESIREALAPYRLD